MTDEQKYLSSLIKTAIAIYGAKNYDHIAGFILGSEGVKVKVGKRALKKIENHNGRN